MTSIRHNPGVDSGHDALLDAARDSILAVGWRRTTLTDVARRAGVSRMTMYRRWPDMQSLLADLLVREWGAVVEGALAESQRPLADRIASTVAALRGDALFRRIVEVDPELLLPYLLERRGRNQDRVLDVLTAAISTLQREGLARAGDPAVLSRAMLLALQGFLISLPIMADVPADRLDAELRLLIERYLAP